MSEGSSYSEEQASILLKQLDHILESDTLIDEVGFIHPSQFVTLNEEAGGSPLLSSEFGAPEYDNTVFWNRDHKLGISTRALLPLYKAAKQSCLNTIRQYKMLSDVSSKHDMVGDDDMPCRLSSFESILEIDIMKHSKTLLLLSSDFGTAWNYRKLIVSKKQQLPIFMDELLLSALVLSYSPKSDHAWSHRRWVIKMIAGKCSNLPEILGKESELVKKIAERFKMNYRAWNHRCWLVPYMSEEQVLHELKKSRNWSALHVADNCCFHYCRRLLLRMLEDFCYKQHSNASFCSNVEIYQVWKEELDWNELLIKRFIGREGLCFVVISHIQNCFDTFLSLWLHRRFLSLYWLKHFPNNVCGVSCHSEHKSSTSYDINIFVDNELQLLNSCFTIPNNEFEDVQAQALFSATYILWLTKHLSDSERFVLQEKLRTVDLKALLNMVCPEKTNLWNFLIGLRGSSSTSSEGN